MEITRDDIITSLQELESCSCIVNRDGWNTAAQNIEESFDALLTENKMMLERLQRIEAIRFQNG